MRCVLFARCALHACCRRRTPLTHHTRSLADYNTYSNESTYDMPPEFAEIAASRDAWQEMADGQWQNQVTGEISAVGWVGHGATAPGVTAHSAPASDARASAGRAANVSGQGSPGWASAQGWDSTCTSDDEQGF